MTTPETVPVIDDDRIAYLALNHLPSKYRADIMAGEWDSVTGMQVLARHRLTAVRELEAQLAEAREENGRLRKLTQGQWFYPADGYEGENCHYSPDEVIDYLDLEVGVHVVEVNVATPLPSIWCAVRVTDDDDADERVTFTEHSSEDKARAFLSRTGGEG